MKNFILHILSNDRYIVELQMSLIFGFLLAIHVKK